MNTSLFFFLGGKGCQDPLTPLICPCYPSIIYVYLSIYGGTGGQGPETLITNWQGMGPHPPLNFSLHVYKGPLGCVAQAALPR